jgi:hypothetical protein
MSFMVSLPRGEPDSVVIVVGTLFLFGNFLTKFDYVAGLSFPAMEFTFQPVGGHPPIRSRATLSR